MSVRDLHSAPSLRHLHAVPDARPEASSEVAEVRFAATDGVVRRTRHWVMTTAARWGIGGTANQVVELLTAEVVANAVVHGPTGAEVAVKVVRKPGGVRVEVCDQSTELPTIRPLTGPPLGGRGLTIVDTLASAWGVAPLDGGKIVWFEVNED